MVATSFDEASAMASESEFAGFTPAALRLLSSLERHNDRDWFAPRKERFIRELVEPMRALVLATTRRFQAKKIPLMGDPRRSVFRIYRDVRFSPDKRPYRTNLAAYLSLDGGRATPGGVYVQIAPRLSFLAIAFYQLERPLLTRWRESMATRPRAFAAVVRALARRDLTIEPPSEANAALAGMPREFTAYESGELAPYFRLRSFVVRRPLAEADVTSAELVERIVELARDAKPLLAFGWALV